MYLNFKLSLFLIHKLQLRRLIYYITIGILYKQKRMMIFKLLSQHTQLKHIYFTEILLSYTHALEWYVN